MSVCENSHAIISFSCNHTPHMEPRETANVSEFSCIFRETNMAVSHIWAFPLHVPDHWNFCFAVLAISSDFHLHTPMYFSFSKLSFVDISFTSATIPKVLRNIQTPEQSYNLWRLHHSGVFFHTVCMFGWLSPDCDGLWPLCGHLPPHALQRHLEPLALDCWFWLAGSSQCLGFILTNLNGVEAVLL